MALRRYERIAYRMFGRQAAAAAARNPRLGSALQKAHIQVRPEVYLAATTLTTLLVVAGTALPVLLLIGASASGAIQLSPRIALPLILIPFAAGGTVYLLSLVLPNVRAQTRARDINAKLPYALNYLSTMASAGAPPEQIFASLGDQPIYGGVADEAALITRDVELLGLDIVTALARASDRASSVRLQDMLQGAITALTSGGDLRTYFANKAEQYLQDNRQEQKHFLENLGVLAESFVTVVVAAPLFLLVILSVMTTMGGSGKETLVLGYALIFVLLPLSQLGFGLILKTVTPEA
jgi:flagellar protein FlaJ